MIDHDPTRMKPSATSNAAAFEKKLLTIPEFMAKYDVGRHTTYNLIGSGELPSVKIGRLRRIKADDAHAWYVGLVAVPLDAA